MKIAVASTGGWLDATVDFHTGRAAFFIVYDTEQENYEVFENWKSLKSHHWAGLKTVNTLIEAGADVVLVRNIGPNSFRRFKSATIDIYHAEETVVVRAIRRFREGRSLRAKEANCRGHLHR